MKLEYLFYEFTLSFRTCLFVLCLLIQLITFTDFLWIVVSFLQIKFSETMNGSTSPHEFTLHFRERRQRYLPLRLIQYTILVLTYYYNIRAADLWLALGLKSIYKLHCINNKKKSTVLGK